MATMNVSLPDPMRDYVRDLIRRDQSIVVDEERWLKELDASIEQSLKEMEAGDGRDLNKVCDEILADIRTSVDTKQH